MSYQYKKSSILYELEQAIKKKVAEKPRAREISQKNMQSSLEKRKVLNQRQSVERLPSKQKQASKPSKHQNFTLFNNENLLHVQAHHTDSKFSEVKKINNRKIDKLFSLINYALSSADKAMKYINYANFQGEFAVKLFKSDKQNLMNEMRNLTADDLVDTSNRQQTSKPTMPSIIILQEENLKLKKELAILEKQNQRTRSGQPKDFELALLLREIQIQKYKQSIYRIRGHDFLQRLSAIIEKQLKYENLLRKGHASATQFDSIFRSLISERNNLCKEANSTKNHEEPHSQQDKINKIRQEKQELMRQIQVCKKKLGEIAQISALKSDLDSLHRENSNIYKILIEKLPEQAENDQISLSQLLIKALSSHQIPIQNQYQSQLNVLQAENQILQKQAQQKQQNMRNLDRQLASVRQQLSQIKKREKKTEENVVEIEKENEYLIGKVEELQEKIQQLQREEEGQRDGQQKLKEQNIRLRGIEQSLQNDKKQLMAKLQQNQSYISELHTRMTEINQENAVNLQGAVKRYEQKLQSLGSSKDKIIAQLQKEKERLTSSSQGSQQKEAELNQCKLNIKKYSLQLLQMQSSMEELQQQYQGLQEKYTKQVEVLREKQDELQQQTDTLEQTKAFLKEKTIQNFAKINEINTLHQNSKQLSAKLISYQNQIRQLKEQEQVHLNKIQILSQSQKKVELLQNKLIDSSKKIELLEQKLSVEQDKEKEKEKEKAESKKVIEMEAQLEKKMQELNQKEGEILDQEYIIKQKQQALEQRERSIQEKEIGLAELSERLNMNSAQLKELQAKLEQLRLQNEERISQIQQKAAQLSRKENLLNENNGKLMLKESELSQRQQDFLGDNRRIQQLQAKIELLEKDKSSLLKQIEDKTRQFEEEVLKTSNRQKLLKQSAENLQQNIKDFTEREQQLLRTIQELDKKYLTTKQQKIAIEDQAQDVKQKLEQMAAAVEKSQSKILELEAKLEDNGTNQTQIEELQAEIDFLKEEVRRSKQQSQKQLGEKMLSANKKQTILLERCGMLDKELIIKAQALDEASELQATLEAENLSNSQTISQLQSKLMKKDEEILHFEEQIKSLKQKVFILTKKIQQKQQEITNLIENPPVQPKSDAEQQNLRRLLDTIQSMEQQIEQYSSLEQQRQKQKQQLEKTISELDQEIEQRKVENSEMEQKYAEVVLKLELTLINMEQMLQDKDKLEEQVKQLNIQYELVLENNKNLHQWKNIQIMYEKQYCNLIKRILRAIIDLDELGNVDEMTIRTLLELGSQKVIEHRMRVRDQESNEKKMRRVLADPQQAEESDQKKGQPAEHDQHLANPFNLKEQQYPQVVEAKISEPIKQQQSAENREKSQEGSLKDIQQFDNVEEGMNNSLISEDPIQPDSVIPENKEKEVIKKEEEEEEQLENPKNNSQILNSKQNEEQRSEQIKKPLQKMQEKEEQDKKIENMEDFNDYQSEKLNESMVSNPNIEGEPKNSDKSGLGFDQFNNFNQSQVDSSLISQTAQQNQQNKNMEVPAPKEQNEPNLIKLQDGHQEVSNGHSKEESEFEKQNMIGMDLSHISNDQPAGTQPHNNSMEFQNFLDFQGSGLNQSMISEKQQGGKNNQEFNNFNDFNDLQSQKLNESMLSEKQFKVQKSEEQQEQKQPEKSQHSETKQIADLQMDNFDDFNSQRMNDSIISNQEGAKPQVHEAKQKPSQANFDEFGDFKVDQMNSSLLSDKDITEI